MPSSHPNWNGPVRLGSLGGLEGDLKKTVVHVIVLDVESLSHDEV